MTAPALTITYRGPRSAAGSALFLEQGEPDVAAGLVTGGIVVSALISSLVGGSVRQPSCGGLSGSKFEADVYAYPSDPLLDYDFVLSWGVPGQRIIEEVTLYEQISFKLTSEETLKYPSRRLLEVYWLGDDEVGDCFDAAGTPITPPTLELSGQTLRSGHACYGSALVAHRVLRHKYTCAISMRPDAAENAWTSQAIAVWRDGWDLLEIAQPSGLDDADNPCGGGSNVTINPPEDGRRVPKYAWGDQDITVNYCSQEADEPQISGREEWTWETA